MIGLSVISLSTLCSSDTVDPDDHSIGRGAQLGLAGSQWIGAEAIKVDPAIEVEQDLGSKHELVCIMLIARAAQTIDRVGKRGPAERKVE